MGFTGGAGIADFWRQQTDGKPPWRDTFFKLSGDAVDGLQSVFAENWLEAQGEVLAAPRLYQSSPVENGYPTRQANQKGKGAGLRRPLRCLLR